MKFPPLCYLGIGAVLSVGCSPQPEAEQVPTSQSDGIDVAADLDAGLRQLDAATGPTTQVQADGAATDSGVETSSWLTNTMDAGLATELSGTALAVTSHPSSLGGESTFPNVVGESTSSTASTEGLALDPSATRDSSWSDAGATRSTAGTSSTTWLDVDAATPPEPDAGLFSGVDTTSAIATGEAGAVTEASASPVSSSDGAAAVSSGVSTSNEVFTSNEVSSSSEPSVLNALQIVGAHTSLYPAFDPTRTRYSVIAEASDAVVGVIASASGAAHLTVNGLALVSGEQLDLNDVVPGSELVIDVGDGPDAAQYVVQYLPTNFPELHVANPNLGATDEPVYLNLASGDGEFIAKLDAAGVPLYYKKASTKIYDFKKHPSGVYSYSVRRSSSKDGAYQVVLDAQFQEIARLSSVGLVNTDVHDFLILNNGNYVFMAYEPATHDLSGFGLSATQKVIDSVFQEVTPEQQVVFQWNSFDHMQYDHSVYAFQHQEWAHANSIALDHDEHWLLSSRGLSQVLKIDRTTGAVIWRLGGVASDFTFVSDPYNGFCGQHTASRLDNGHVLVFDNSKDCLPEVRGDRPQRSRILEYALDEVGMTAELVWSYEREGFVASSQGSAQRLSNGNTMIGWGNGPAAIATEVTASGDVVYELTAQARNGSDVSCYRARKFPD